MNKPLRTLPLYTVRPERETAKFVRVRVDGHAVHFKVDIGAGDAVVSAIFPELYSKLETTGSRLMGPGTQVLSVSAMFHAAMNYKCI